MPGLTANKGVIIITGAGQRVGLHCALALQQQGYQLVVSYRTQTSSIAALQQAGVHCVRADFNQLTDIAAFVEAMAAYPAIRAIIHNASSWQPDIPLAQQNGQHDVLNQLQQDAAVFDAMHQVHAKVPYLLNRALLPKLLAADDTADIIHLTDFVASVGSSKHQAYAASKASLENLTLSLARQLARASADSLAHYSAALGA